MRTLETLIKRARKDVDALAVEMRRALETRGEIIAEMAACEASIEAEASMFDGTPMAGLGFAAFLDRQKLRKANLDEALKLAEKAHAECQEAMNAAYAELKKLEHLLSMEKTKARVEEEKKEQAVFDERSSQMFGR
ncbi:flagellar export protein FliJ [Ponticaulis sp.]|uniref:flagellar export protein FliJ n=1 Tax=Ponticaulis sp. TaxID=2020902 RepID=UPI000B644C4C|nr:flagellar FliJ family protein [Ponticaulis sp.]MAI90516.1 hypothetical protein [Ponticaulis sp.]OUY00210.1 MAG: hypothetical protein CBB65_08765 [Hyphomonadaceae bacterium TMED5]|tara:strand:+ start:145006 stop:145413 length:408 start_codon:yes stop_codon:yes gene_type:complete